MLYYYPDGTIKEMPDTKVTTTGLIKLFEGWFRLQSVGTDGFHYIAFKELHGMQKKHYPMYNEVASKKFNMDLYGLVIYGLDNLFI